MAAVKESVSYPMFSSTAWWAIRKKFIQSVPQRVTDTYLSTLLSMEIKSARNLIPTMKKVGLIDNDGKPTERAGRWRIDDQYAQVCEEIRQEIYPHELLDIFPNADAPRVSIENWFASRAGVGAGAKKAMTTFYLLLAEADYTKQDQSNSVKNPKAAKNGASAPKTTFSRIKTEKVEEANNGLSIPGNNGEAPKSNGKFPSGIEPSLHIDIQIHIASDAPPDQIEQIFASMAKHLYRVKDRSEQ